MQLMPKQLIGNIGGSYIKNSKSVIFHPTPCEALESLTKVMTAGFVSVLKIFFNMLYILIFFLNCGMCTFQAGCVHFTSASSSSACEIKVLLLLYTVDKKSYLGFIPNDQTAFVERLRKVIQQQKSSHASLRQAQVSTMTRNKLFLRTRENGSVGD